MSESGKNNEGEAKKKNGYRVKAANGEIEYRATRQGSKPKFDYTGTLFLRAIEEMARQGFSDAAIAYGLADKFEKCLSPSMFATIKGEKNKKGEPTPRSVKIKEALARGRVDVNMAARATYLQLALGQRQVKSETTQKMKMKDGTTTEDEVISTTVTDIPPSLQALSTWLFNHDPEWRENIIAHKREEAEAMEAEQESGPTEVNVAITYNQREDLELQEKFKTPSQ